MESSHAKPRIRLNGYRRDRDFGLGSCDTVVSRCFNCRSTNDSRLGDPLGHFTLTDDEFVELTKVLLDIAERHAGGRLVSVLEGGYNTAGLAAAVAAHIGELMRA